MKSLHCFSRVLASALLAGSLLSITALAAPAESSSTNTSRVDRGPNIISSSQATAGNRSPIPVSPDQATGNIQVSYHDKNGNESSANVSVVAQNAKLYACVNAGGDSLRVRQGPGTNYGILCSVFDGDFFPITGKTNGWYQISCNGRTGYVSAEFVIEKHEDEINHPGGNPGGGDLTLAQQIVDYALQYLGYPYVYGTAGPNTFDCSGFTSYVFKHFGYTLNRSSKDQLYNGMPVTKDQLQPADLLLFSSNGTVVTHVGIYIGDGQLIHASTPTSGVIISDLNSNYYTTHFFAARRII
ncbi:MAG: SH3 domain-containing C40 family peptidase [Evtepia sp.]|uniref:C40 family peptidase n=1 Tax=Evtepia sp. TaxID=2773933 RepID=UPI002A74FDEC|nr:SH3 domain-containing C40 family peptidase [Evtepia sp.]MDY3014386.1 SH3 domain-containing C40 family peptidase [Evtepia sp.]